MTRILGMGGIVCVAIVGCGSASAPPVSSVPATPPSAVPSSAPPAAASNQAVRAHARQINGAAVQWRGDHDGDCPTLRNVLERYAFPPGTEVDAGGAAFTIECTDAEVRVIGSGHEVLDAQGYAAPVRYKSDPLHDPNAPAPGVPVASAEAVIRTLLFPRAKRCYQKGLEQDPTQSGSLAIEIGPTSDGCHPRVKVTPSSGTLSPQVVKCVSDVLAKLDYCPSGNAGAVIQKPITFTVGGE
jgi:hypothetical protein